MDQRREELPVDTATSLRLCGVTGVQRGDLLLALPRPASPSCTRPGSVGVRRRRGSAGRYRALCATIGQDVRVHQPSGAVARGRAVAVDDSGRLVLDGPAGRQAHAAGDVVHVRPPA